MLIRQKWQMCSVVFFLICLKRNKTVCTISVIYNQVKETEKVIEILEKRGDLQINTLVVEADIPVQKMNTILFELEMKGVVRVLVGGMYQLL